MSDVGIRQRINKGFTVFCALQVVMMFGLATYSYHRGEDRSLARVVGGGQTVLETFNGLNEVPSELKSTLADLKPGIHEVTGHAATDPRNREIHVFVEQTGEGQNRYQALIVDEPADISGLIRDYTIFSLMALVCVMTFGVWAGRTIAGRICGPLEQLARDLKSRVPDSPDTQVAKPGSANEVNLVTDAINTALARVDAALLREKMFTRNVSHELRTPLTVIRSAVENVSNNSQNKASLQRAVRASGEMALLVDACLDLAREQQPENATVRIDLNNELKQMVRECVHLLGDRAVILDLDLPHRPVLVNGSRGLIRLVIGNVLRNAFLHSTDDDIEVSLIENRLIVKNNVATADDDHHFDRTRGSSASCADQNHGFGLSILGQACERLKWKFVLTSPRQSNGIVSVHAQVDFANI